MILGMASSWASRPTSGTRSSTSTTCQARRFHLEGESPRGQGQAQLFFSLYFAMTGLHALHMIIGVGLLLRDSVAVRTAGKFSPAYFTPVDIAGLYWHFVDIIWIFLFPLLYLVDRHMKG